jgi:hypothetical protein
MDFIPKIEKDNEKFRNESNESRFKEEAIIKSKKEAMLC